MTRQRQAEAEPTDQLRLIEAFEDLEDPRRRASCAYALDGLLLTALCAVTSGADDWVSVALWGEEKLDWPRRFLPFERGVSRV